MERRRGTLDSQALPNRIQWAARHNAQVYHATVLRVYGATLTDTSQSLSVADGYAYVNCSYTNDPFALCHRRYFAFFVIFARRYTLSAHA